MTVLGFHPSPASHNLAVALDVARAGAFVFPCQSEGPNRKQPFRGIYWRSMSTRDEARVLQLWQRHPNAVAGLDLAKMGLLVVDCDKKPTDGLAWLTEQAALHSDDLTTPPAVDTPSGGRHLYFRNDFQPEHGNGRGSLPPKKECGIDIRGSGGFVIAPGSLFTDDGGLYREHGSIFDASSMPDWLRAILQPPARPLAFSVPASDLTDNRLSAYGDAALAELMDELAAASEGTRNDTANAIAFRAGQLVGGRCLAHSAAYQALEQAVLSWGVSPRDKALGPKGTLARALQAGEKSPRGPAVETQPTVQILLHTGDRFDPQTGEILEAALPAIPAEPTQPPTSELPDHLTRVPGLVGEITDWICDTALYPQRGLALGAALTIVGTAAGRHLAGPNKCGTHLYVVGLAPSGAGKNHPLTQIAVILAEAGMRPHIGPSQFISMPAVINFLCRAPLSVCAMDEFGSFLKRINNRRASGFEGAISGLLRSAWGASFSAMATPEWAQRASETIFSPALSIFGVSTPREFYDSLEGADVTNGVLNRFLVIETKRRPPERVPTADSSQVPSQITNGLKRLYTSGGPLNMLCQSTVSPTYRTLAISPDAEQIRRGLVQELHNRGDADASLEPFLARTAENALRLATIVTAGMHEMTIEAETMAWAREFSLWSTDALAQGAGLYIADSETQAVANAVRRVLSEDGGWTERRKLIRRLAHRYRPRDVEDAIKMMIESEEIALGAVPSKEKGGRPSFKYRLVVGK